MIVALDPPLEPSGDDARGLLRRELADPQYIDRNIVQRLIDWLERSIGGTVDGARGIPSLTWFAITVVVVALVAALVLLAGRARGTARVDRGRDHAVLTDEAVTATELRARAEQALVEARFADAVVDGFRALARRQVERGRLADSPGVTAHEVARSLATEYPGHRERTVAGADLFDAVLYGDRPATRDQAAAVLALDLELAGTR